MNTDDSSRDTNWPALIDLDRNLLPGLAAVGIFLVMATVFLTADLTDVTGLEGISTVSGIGYALLGAAEHAGEEVVYENTESFLVALVLIAVLLDAALDGALMLAKRDDGGEQ